ncbi:hypothetical protein EJ04DRAFT_564126 [Polyplosphaeria fusca]|uniref:Antifreeze protein n=1 Tax=Polyplosphaeria fusca TaxID=682080 RepID=A0A9P4V1I4_9PLEO|nr:hypothetical protein EJ04DRAFT_564126 [Polyplosphaeria fusca]
MLNLKQILTFGALFAGAHALPEPTNALKPRAVDCKAVNKALSCLKTLGAPATAFCSSYLHIPATTTITSTAVANTVTVTTTTVTIATTSPVCPAAKRYLVPRHFMAAERRGFAVAAEPAPQVYKRNNIPQLSSFAAAQLSSGCSCLGLAPKTATTTFTPPPSTVGTIMGFQFANIEDSD